VRVARNDWRLCDRCDALFLPEPQSGLGIAGGVCGADPLGGPHSCDARIEYAAAEASLKEGQPAPEWELCRKCRVLYSIADSTALGACPGNITGEGSYLPHESDHTQERASMTFALDETNAAGEGQGAGWQVCDSCRVLFYAGGAQAAICPGAKGASHKSTSGVTYVVNRGGS
jgi:hypothetical protein